MSNYGDTFSEMQHNIFLNKRTAENVFSGAFTGITSSVFGYLENEENVQAIYCPLNTQIGAIFLYSIEDVTNGTYSNGLASGTILRTTGNVSYTAGTAFTGTATSTLIVVPVANTNAQGVELRVSCTTGTVTARVLVRVYLNVLSSDAVNNKALGGSTAVLTAAE